MNNNILFSIIIPHRDSIGTLSRLIASIPDSSDIEVIVVDNAPVPITKEEINSVRDFRLLWSSPDRHAGGARNVGIENARGKWMIFADADDYFTSQAFDVFRSYSNRSSDIIYFASEGIYDDTGEYSNRGEVYTNLVKGYVKGTNNETDVRIRFNVPWAKMVRSSFIEEHGVRYDEVVASNDVFFSVKSGLYAREIYCVDSVVYMVTVSRGSLTQRRSFDVIISRYKVTLRTNQFLRRNNQHAYQQSIMLYLFLLMKLCCWKICYYLWLLVYYRQNPFIGCRNWVKSLMRLESYNKSHKKYIVRN